MKLLSIPIKITLFFVFFQRYTFLTHSSIWIIKKQSSLLRNVISLILQYFEFYKIDSIFIYLMGGQYFWLRGSLVMKAGCRLNSRCRLRSETCEGWSSDFPPKQSWKYIIKVIETSNIMLIIQSSIIFKHVLSC